MPSGTVAELWRYPVKSMGGEPVRSMRVDHRGAGGDRTHALAFSFRGIRRHLTARQAPRLLAWRAEYPFAADAGLDPARPPQPQLITPDGQRLNWADARLRRRLAEDLGRPVELLRDVAGQQDLADTLLVTTAASLRALSDELQTAVDLRRFRTNLHLELDAPAWAELDWEGRTVALEGGVVLELLHPCVRCVIPTRSPDTQEKWPQLLKHLDAHHRTCFGINARVVAGGRLALGQTVTVT